MCQCCVAYWGYEWNKFKHYVERYSLYPHEAGSQCLPALNAASTPPDSCWPIRAVRPVAVKQGWSQERPGKVKLKWRHEGWARGGQVSREGVRCFVQRKQWGRGPDGRNHTWSTENRRQVQKEVGESGQGEEVSLGLAVKLPWCFAKPLRALSK